MKLSSKISLDAHYWIAVLTALSIFLVYFYALTMVLFGIWQLVLSIIFYTTRRYHTEGIRERLQIYFLLVLGVFASWIVLANSSAIGLDWLLVLVVGPWIPALFLLNIHYRIVVRSGIMAESKTDEFPEVLDLDL